MTLGLKEGSKYEVNVDGRRLKHVSKHNYSGFVKTDPAQRVRNVAGNTTCVCMCVWEGGGL